MLFYYYIYITLYFIVILFISYSDQTDVSREWRLYQNFFIRFIEAVEDLELARYSEDSKINSLIEQFERYSHSDLLEEIKSLKVYRFINQSNKELSNFFKLLNRVISPDVSCLSSFDPLSISLFYILPRLII